MGGNNSRYMKLWWATRTAKQRARQTSAAHAARRGQKDSLKVRTARATGRYVLQVGIGPREITFSKLLDAAGIKYRQQVPLGPYNLDFTINKSLVAVEIATGAGNRRVSARRKQRLKSVLNQYHLFKVHFDAVHPREYRPKLIKELIAFLKKTRRLKPSPGQYRMVWPNGETYIKRRYGPGNPIPISRMQINEAALLLRQGRSAKEVSKITGIVRRRVQNMRRKINRRS